jgi:hypothetical protein
LCVICQDRFKTLVIEKHTLREDVSIIYNDYTPLLRYADAAYNRSYETADTVFRS